MIQCSWVELDEFHILHRSLCAVHHGYAIACSHKRVGSGGVHSAGTAGSHQRHFRQELVNISGVCVKHVGSVACYVGSAAGYYLTQMVLGYYFYCKMIFKYVNLVIGTYRLDKSALDLKSGIVGMMEDSEFGVPSFTVQVKAAILLAVELNAPFQQLLDLLRGLAHHFAYSLSVAEPVAGYHSVFNMFFEIVDLKICY